MAAYDLTTTANVKSHLGISVTTWDTLLASLITSCSVFIENYCGGIRFKNSGSDVTEYHDGDPDAEGRKIIFVKNYPIISITSVSYSSGSLSSPTWNVYDASSYYVQDNNRGEICFETLPVGKQNIRVVYQGGYNSIPEDLALACILMVARMYTRRNSEGVTNESVGGASVNWSTELSTEIRKTLNRYRNYAV